MQPEYFENTGYGWVCKDCGSKALVDREVSQAGGRARFFTEGEAETKEPVFSSLGLARWRDSSHRTLVCTSCGREEKVNGGL
jgi:hypothetical protein